MSEKLKRQDKKKKKKTLFSMVTVSVVSHATEKNSQLCRASSHSQKNTCSSHNECRIFRIVKTENSNRIANDMKPSSTDISLHRKSRLPVRAPPPQSEDQ